MDRENFPKGEDRKLAGRTTREPIEPRNLLIESADPVVRWGRPVPSVMVNRGKKSRWAHRGRRDGMRGKLHRVTREISFVAGDGRDGSV